ncbi:MAG: hypothetical protein A3H32_01700 [Betaproteobacteria bacterium RIFCSPLOWO2_02_FULL_63_19]|nr:MAG: hypothetical protein A3H32_01700 [Betaproteobacteria bacterium RIFCSPLOWO2_02_FULL_63_19]
MPMRRPTMLGTMVLALFLALAWFRPLDTVAEQYTESGLKRAFATFAAARAMNATISVLQSASVNFQVGAGASLQMGAVLEPLDDIVEQFSALMLAATLSFATQRLLIEISGAWPVSMLLTVLFLAWGVFHTRNGVAPEWLLRLLLGLLCLRFAVPIAALGGEATYRLFLASSYEASQVQVKSADVPDVDLRADEGLVERFKRWWAQSTDIGKKIAALKERADGWIEHIVRLAALFIVQTIVLPLLFLGAMLWLYRVLSAPFRSSNMHGTTTSPHGS